jgi:hypothetical protein
MKPCIEFRGIRVDTLTRNILRALVAAIFLVSMAFAGRVPKPSSKAARAESFDVPIKTTKIVKLHHIDDSDPQDAHKLFRNTLTCYYYPGLMVKQDCEQGQMYCEWLAVQRFRGKRPACTMSQAPGEWRYKDYLGIRGVKGSLVFFDAGECEWGGCTFAVFDSITGKKIFEDDDAAWLAKDEAPMRFVFTKAGVVVRYTRVSQADCDIHKEGKSCWEKVQAEFHLERYPMPHCEGYSPKDIAELTGDPNESLASSIDYPVEVTLSAHPVIKTLAGRVRCWPQN